MEKAIIIGGPPRQPLNTMMSHLGHHSEAMLLYHITLPLHFSPDPPLSKCSRVGGRCMSFPIKATQMLRLSSKPITTTDSLTFTADAHP